MKAEEHLQGHRCRCRRATRLGLIDVRDTGSVRKYGLKGGSNRLRRWQGWVSGRIGTPSTEHRDLRSREAAVAFMATRSMESRGGRATTIRSAPSSGLGGGEAPMRGGPLDTNERAQPLSRVRLFRSPKMIRGEGSVKVSLFIQSRRLPRASAHPHVRRSAHLRQPGPGTPFPGDVQ